MDLSKNPYKKEIQKHVKEALENNENEFSFENIKAFAFKHKLVEIYGSLKSELGSFF